MKFSRLLAKFAVLGALVVAASGCSMATKLAAHALSAPGDTFTSDDDPELVRKAIARHGIAGRVIVAGFNPAATRPLRGAGFALGASTPDVARLVLPALLRRRLGAPPFQALCIPPRWNRIPVPITALARALRGSGTVIHVWTINDPADAIGLWNVGVQGIVSDDPATILAARSRAAVR